MKFMNMMKQSETGVNIRVKKVRKGETLLFAAAMIAVSGACLAYNIRTASDMEITASLSELVYVSATDEYGAVSDIAAANLEHRESVAASAVPSTQSGADVRELLPPVVVPNG